MTARYIIPKSGDPMRDRIQANAIRAIEQSPDNHPTLVELKRYRRPRSNPQNATLWGVIYPPIMEHMGLRGEQDREDLHEFWCGEYFGWRQTAILGKTKQHPIRTTTTDENGKRDVLATVDFMDFCAFIQQRMAEHGVVIPDPDPMHGRVA